MGERGSILPFLSFMSAGLTLLIWFADLGPAWMIPFFITLVIAIAGIIFGHRDKPLSSRISCLLAIIMAAMPFITPAVQDFRLKQLEAQRARETAPVYEELNQIVEDLKDPIARYYRTEGVMPDLHEDELLPFISAQGELRYRRPMDGIKNPRDPFDETRNLRWVAVRDTGVLLVSVGQDKVPEMPLPGVPMDGPPMHPFVPFAQVGYDIRRTTYDPTNGALSLGDVVRWVGREEYEEAFAPLFNAWDRAAQESEYDPTVKMRDTAADPNPQSRRDAVGANKLLREGEWLAALALSSRGLNERTSYENEWDSAERSLGLSQGVALYNLGAYREAADALTLYLDQEPNDALGHYYLAAALWRAGKRESARLHMAAASQIDPNASILNQATQAYQKMLGGQQPDLPEPWVLREAQEDSAGEAEQPLPERPAEQ